ncbi:glycerophosphodiester phosphodiesterase family protein [Marinobacter litoralis]|uniref:glycerophosphodiester phosphodiesterase family protein n=1 Tax=Marinobacter litoralis TaxID=187981 RepID=UPI0018EA5630|nr:glycerophosphodiester phosphodiesterase family protein [Marinobacter litoralis]MBJ6137536.1 glycerophosphoryl diester phosphodiesterase membrane domain-containing protein [Marinobacter litoralis]
MLKLTSRTLALLRQHSRPLLALHLTITGVSVALLPSLVAAALAAIRPLTGEAAITTAGLIRFLTSTGGITWAGFTMFVTVAIIVYQQAGITLLVAQNDQHPMKSIARALFGVVRRITGLTTLALLLTLAHFLTALPFLAAIIGASKLLLHHYDPYLLNLERPPVLWWYGAFCLAMVAGLVASNGTLIVRWSLAIPRLMLTGAKPVAALRSSYHLTRKRSRDAATTLALGAALTVAIPPFITLIFNALATGIFQILPDNKVYLFPAVITLVGSYVLIGLAVTFLATSAFGTLVMAYYEERSDSSFKRSAPSAPKHAATLIRRAWVLEAVVVAVVLVQSYPIISSLNQSNEVGITAHRGNASLAPENTVSAIQQAINDGSDYIEIDVQLTADGVPVLWHDTDMQRIFGLPERINDLPFKQLRTLDAGSWFDETFADERIATLADAIEATRGKANLLVDLKPNRNEDALVNAVVKVLQENDAVEGTVIAAADWPVLERAKTLEPNLRTALLAQFVVGPLWQDRYDILGIRANRASPAMVARAHEAGNELFVWTVNSPKEMARFIDMGVDNIITDRPNVLSQLMERRSKMDDAERLANRLRNWLR